MVITYLNLPAVTWLAGHGKELPCSASIKSPDICRHLWFNSRCGPDKGDSSSFNDRAGSETW